MVSEDVHASYERALDAWAKSYVEPHQKPWGQTVAYMRDANGFLVELCSAMGNDVPRSLRNATGRPPFQDCGT